MDPHPLTVSLLGGFELRCGTDTVLIRSDRIRALLAWLALQPDVPQPRLRVASALWPDSSENQARTNLRNLIHQLRRAFPEIDRYLDCAGSLLAWRPAAPISVDAVEFERALKVAMARAGGREACAALQSALALYRGTLLPDCYERWVAPEQERIRRLHRTGLQALLDCHLEAEEFGRAREVSEWILDHDNLDERAHRARITTLAASGDRAGALQALQECTALLEAELGVRPSAATLDAYSAALGAEAPSVVSDPSVAERNPTPAVAAQAPLVGRRREAATLRRIWAHTVASQSRVLWVTGEPGIGKTRLLQSFMDWVRRQDEDVVQARAYPTQGARAYGPVIEWLRSPVLASALAVASPVTRSELRRLLPELKADAPPPDPRSLTEAERRQRLHDAVISVLSTERVPSTLIIDDLQWSDQETVDLLSTLVFRSPRPLLIVAAVRTSETGPEHPVAEAEARLRAADRLERVELRPLTLEETGELVRALLEEGVMDEEVRALHRETEGNPLFIVETARMGRPWGVADDNMASKAASPPRIRSVIEARLGLLSPEAREVTRLAATIGREFTLSLLLNVSPLDEESTLRGLEEAWRRSLVRERDGDRYDFSHGKIREVAYRTTSPIRRRGYHQRVAEALEAWQAGETIAIEPTADQIALHYDRGGSAASAVDWYRRAASSAMEVSALDAVRQLLGRAIELIERLPPSRRRDEVELDMRLNHGSALVALEGYGQARSVETYERARELCTRLGRPVDPPILRALALAALSAGDLHSGSEFGYELARAAERDGDGLARVEGAYVSGVMAFWKGDLSDSAYHLSHAIAAYRPERHREHILLYAQDPKVVCLSRLAWTLWLQGRVTDALGRRDEAIALAGRHGDPMSLAYALWFTAFVAVDQGDVERLAAQAEQMERIATAHRLLYSEAVAEGLLGYVDAVRGDARRGIARMRDTLADQRWLGMEYVMKAQTLFLIARAAASAGDVEGGRDAVREALAYLGTGPSVWKAPLLQIDARLLALEDRTGERALSAFRKALEEARACGAAWTELGVALDRARWVLEQAVGDAASVGADLKRALVAYEDSPSLPAVVAARILLERLIPGGLT